MSLAFEVFTLFPEAIESFLRSGLIGKAQGAGLVEVHCTNFRDFTRDRHRTVDDTPYGGGAGMLMKIEPVVAAMESVIAARGPMHRILVTPSAPRFDQRAAERLAALPRIALLCGRYEGIDDRVRDHYIDECFSLGDFILNGGEIAALAIIEAVSRLREGVLHNPESIAGESFTATDEGTWLEHPSYTRPPDFRGHRVPEVLLGGDHPAIARWRAEAAFDRTWALRRDLRPERRLAPARPLLLALEITGALAGALAGDLIDGLLGLGHPLWVIARRSVAVAPPAIAVTDRKSLRRAVRRAYGAAPHLVELALSGPEAAAITSPSQLLDRLALAAAAKASASPPAPASPPNGAPAEPPLILLVRGEEIGGPSEDETPGRSLARKPHSPADVADACFALAPSAAPANRLELAPGARMIDSSQPRKAAEVVDLVALAVARLGR